MSADRREPDEEPETPEDQRTRQAVEAERALLGLVLLTDDGLARAGEAGICAASFWRPVHQVTWELGLKAASEGRPVSATELARDVIADRAARRAFGGGPLYLHGLIADRATGSIEHFARQVLDAAELRRWAEVGQRLQQMADGLGADPATIRLEMLDLIEQEVQSVEREAGPGSSWSALDLTPILAGHDLDPPPELGYRTDSEALFYREALHVVAAEPESGKTFLALWLALTTMQAGHPVAFLDFEAYPKQIAARLLQLGATPRMLAGAEALIRYVRPHDVLDPAAVPDLDRACAGARLVIIDGMTEALSMHALDQNSSNDVARFYEMLPRRARRVSDDGAVVMIDHVKKDKDTRDRWAIGSQHKLAGIDVMYQLAPVEPMSQDRHGWARLTISKDRAGHLRQHALGGRIAGDFHLDATGPATKAWVEPVLGMPTTAAGDMRPTVIMEKVSRWLEAHPGAGEREIRAAVGGTATYLTAAVRCLVAEEYVTSERVGRTREHRVAQPFRVESDPGEKSEIDPSRGW